jgi:hypothetical protein
MRLRLTLALFGALLLVAACRPAPGKPALPATAGQPLTAATPRPTLALATPAAPPPLLLDAAPALVVQPPPAAGQPTLADFWAGRARFVVDVADTGLPMGESDTVAMSNGELWSFVHASDRSAGVVDSCGAAVEFPGCLVIYRSVDGGVTFTLPGSPPVCQIPCRQCPCPEDEHVRQQQYPRVFFDGDLLTLVYEYLGRVMVRRSPDTATWTPAEHMADTTIWHLWFRDCVAAERIGRHPFAPFDYECLAGGPPGLYIEGDTLFVFTALGQNPSAMGCFFAAADGIRAGVPPLRAQPALCRRGQLRAGGRHRRGGQRALRLSHDQFGGGRQGGRGRGRPLLHALRRGAGSRAGRPGRYAVRGGAGALADGSSIDGPWEKFPGNPLLVDLPGNIGLGHADLVVIDGRTYLYTALDGVTRSRLALEWVDS